MDDMELELRTKVANTGFFRRHLLLSIERQTMNYLQVYILLKNIYNAGQGGIVDESLQLVLAEPAGFAADQRPAAPLPGSGSV